MCVSQPTQAMFRFSPRLMFSISVFSSQEKTSLGYGTISHLDSCSPFPSLQAQEHLCLHNPRYHFSPRLMFSISVFTSLGTSPSSQAQDTVPFFTSSHVLHPHILHLRQLTSLGLSSQAQDAVPFSTSPHVLHLLQLTSLGLSLPSAPPNPMASFAPTANPTHPRPTS